MDQGIPVLETRRLRLRPFTLSDTTTVRTLAGTAEVARMTLGILHPYPEGAAEAWIAMHADQATRDEVYTWAITRQSDEAVVGALSLMLTLRHARGEFGYWLGMPFWNQGYMTEAAQRVVEFGFTNVDLHRVQGLCLPHNAASARVLEKAGLQYEGTLHGYFRQGTTFVDVAMYARLQASGSS